MAKVHTGLSVTFLLIIILTGIVGFSLNDGVCSYQKREKTGNVKFLVVAGIREPGTDGTCSSTISQTTYDNLAALEWILTIINGKKANNVSFIPELTIGYDLYDNCDNEDLTTDLLYSGYMAGQNMSCSATTDDTPVYIGVISLTTPEATLLISRYTNPLPVFRPLMSSPFLQSHDHSNLLQTVVAFKHEALAITKMLTTIRWNYVILIHTETTNEEAEVFAGLAHAHGICLKYRGLPTDDSIKALHSALSEAYDKSIAVVYFGKPSYVIDFINIEYGRSRPYQSSVHWVFTSRLASRNIKVKHIVDTITYVQYPENSISDFSTAFKSITIPNLPRQRNFPSLNPYHVTDAVMASVYATKQIWNNVCDKSSSIENCQEFSNKIKTGELLDKVKQGLSVREVYGEEYRPHSDYNKSIRFEDNGSQKYDLLELERSPADKIGNYAIDGGFELSENVKLTDLPTSASGLDQHECLEQVNLRYSYLHGDVLLLGLFTVRNAGSSPFQCGLIRRGVNDIITVSSFFQSVLSRRKETDKYKFGAIAIDDCYNGINTNGYLTDLFSKKRIIRDPLTGNVINFDDVIVVIGALSSPVTLVVADLATSIKVPMLSYSASSPDLDNKNRYPYFLRSVPSDSLQVHGMIQLLVKLGVSHVGLLYIDDAYGKAGKIRLEEGARLFNICVETPIKLTQNMTNEHVEIHVVNELYNQQVRVVLYFGIDTIAKQILDVMDGSRVPFVFIASEAWGMNEKLISGSAGQISKGSIVFNIDTKSNANPDYKTYLQSLDKRQAHSDTNRWISKYFEDYNGCYSIDSFEKPKFPQPIICTNDFNYTLNANTTNYLDNDQRAVHTMNSVFAATESFRAICKENCSSAGIKKNIDGYYDAMSKAYFKDTNTKMFDEDGNGNIGYTIYNIQMRTSQSPQGETIYTSVYEPIGSYSKNGKLDLIKFPTFYDERHNEINEEEFMNINEIHCSTYQVTQTCSKVCPLVTTTTPTTVVTKETATVPPNSDEAWKTVAIAFIFGFGILVLVLIVMLIRPCLIRRTSSEKGDSSGRTTSVTGSHSVYDEPGSVRRKDFDNLVFMPDSASLRSNPNTLGSLSGMHMSGSGISLNNYPPTQYSHVRQMSNPELRFHHVRQASNQELQSHTFDSLERPQSTLSAPAYKPNTLTRNSPAAKRTYHPAAGKHKIGKQTYSPKTPHSAPVGEKKQPVIYRPRTQSSPRFRYPSTDESHYTMPTIDSNEELMRRKYGVSDDDINSHYNVSDHSVNGDSYLEFETARHNEDEPKLNYLSAKDLMTNQSDEEEDAIETSSGDETVQYTDAAFLQTSPPIGANSAAPPSGLNLSERQTHRQPSSSLTVNSTPDSEVMNINFPPSENKQSLKATVQSLTNTGPTMNYNRNNSITDVPDVIKHGLIEEDGVFII